MLPHLSNEHSHRIEAPARFFAELGNLHDAKILRLEWNPAERKVVLTLDDLYSNFVGLPEHTGRQPVCLVMSGVSRLEIDATPDKFPLRIVDFEIDEATAGTEMHVVVNLGPSGLMRATFDSIAGHAAGL